MRDNIERIFKEQLEHYELPYEAGAWEAMSKRLNGSPSTPFYHKWWFATFIGTILVSTAVFFTLSRNEPQNEQTAAKATVAAPAAASQVATASDWRAAAPQASGITAAAQQPAVSRAEVLNVSAIPDLNGSPVVELIQQVIDPSGNASETTGEILSADPKLNAPVLPAAVCLNEPFTITNPNAIDMFVKLPGGTEYVIAGRKSLQIVPAEAGTISVRSGKVRETVTVNAPASRIYIDADASVLYENGIPTVKFEATGAESEVSWETNVAFRSVDKNRIVVHPFREKKVEVIASSTDQNGCPVTEKKSIIMEDSYNLIAMDAFRPLSDIPENRLFMPFALQVRDAAFELTIIDPKTGATVYRSNDPANGWNGTDIRKGEMVPEGSIWSWKVVLKNPLPGEQHIYSGTVTRL